jgi:hypothetical protein
MNARTLLAVGCAVALSACAGGSLVINERYFPNGVVLLPLDAKTNVNLQDDTIVVNREPFKVRAVQFEGRWQPMTITFKLVGQTQGYEFAPFDPPNPLKWTKIPDKPYQAIDRTDCTLSGDKSEMSCTFTPKGNGLFYAYTLRIKKPDGSFVSSDPSFMN